MTIDKCRLEELLSTLDSTDIDLQEKSKAMTYFINGCQIMYSLLKLHFPTQSNMAYLKLLESYMSAAEQLTNRKLFEKFISDLKIERKINEE